MLYGNDKKILKFSNRFVIEDDIVDPYKVIDKLKNSKDIQDFERSIKHLESEGYVAICEKQDNLIITYKLTHKGYHYLDIQFELIKEFLIKSVIVPILVAAITAFLTVYFTINLPKML